MTVPNRLANAVGYQLVWLCAAVGAGQGLGWSGPLAAFLFAAWTIRTSKNRPLDLRLALLALLLGATLDGLFAVSGWLHYAQSWPSSSLAPAWICAIWIAFALTLNHSLAFLRHRLWLAAALGAVGGPLAYLSAARLGALTFGAAPDQVLVAIAVAWAIVLPGLVRATHGRSNFVKRSAAT